jgi:hypothetical protein
MHGYSVLSGNSPGSHRDASAAGNARRSGARAHSDVSTPLSTKAETIWRSPVPTVSILELLIEKWFQFDDRF